MRPTIHTGMSQPIIFTKILPFGITEISDTLLKINKNTKIKVQYFFDGYPREISGNAIIDIPFQTLKFDKEIVKFDDILDIKVLN